MSEIMGEKKEEFDIREIYTPLSVAKKEIWRRWNDKELKKKVEDFLGEIPEPFKKEPRAVLSRSIITPNQEFFYFLDLAKSSKLKPIGLEGVEDKFCTKNPDKVCLGKLSFYKKARVKNNYKDTDDRKSVLRIIDLVSSDGKRICDIKTYWGENLVDFHHRILDQQSKRIELFDDFKWFTERNKKKSVRQYYENFFALFTCYGIVFENFHEKGKEEMFTRDIICKSFNQVFSIFKVKPIIVPLVPIEDERYLDYWNSYIIS